MLALLAAAGVLIDYPASLLREMPAELRSLLWPELAAASLARLDADGGARCWPGAAPPPFRSAAPDACRTASLRC